MIIAVDTGGTKTLIARFDLAGNIEQSTAFPTPKDTTEYVEQVVSAIKEFSDYQSPDAISIAVPGTIVDGVIELCINLDWHNFDLLGELRKHFPDCLMIIDNDANLGGVGEARSLGEMPKKCLYVTLGTGIGTGFIVDGKVDQGLTDSEAGHMRFSEGDQTISWEELAGGIRLKAEFGSIMKIGDDQVFAEIGRRVSLGLLILLPTFRPDLVIIGGGIGAFYPRFAGVVEKQIEQLPAVFQAPIVQATKPKEAVAYGCYYSAIDQLNR